MLMRNVQDPAGVKPIPTVVRAADLVAYACVGQQNFLLAAGDFLFLPRGAAAALRTPTGRRASGFLIEGRVPSSTSYQ